MAAYASAALVLAWIPVLGALAFTTLHSPYGNRHPERIRTTFLTTLVTVVVGFVPVASF